MQKNWRRTSLHKAKPASQNVVLISIIFLGENFQVFLSMRTTIIVFICLVSESPPTSLGGGGMSSGYGSPRVNGGSQPEPRPSSRTRVRPANEDFASVSSAALDTPPPSVHFHNCAHSNSVLALLNELRGSRELCDVVLRVGSAEIAAHKAVLCANSPYFRAMFTSTYSETTQKFVELHEICPAAMEELVGYFYTSKLHVSTANVQDLLPAASMLQVTSIKRACCDFMKRHLGISNCLGLRSFADTHSCPDLKKLAENFAKQNFMKVLQSEEFLKLQVEQVIELLAAEDLNVGSEEERVFEAALVWIKHDPTNREKYIGDLLQQVRLPLLSPAYLCDHVSKEGVVRGSPRAMQLLMQAVEYHLLPERRPTNDWRSQPRSAGNKTEVMVVVGGMNRREPTVSTEYFDPFLKNWRPLAPMATSRWGAGLVTLADEIYAVGGSNESSRLSSVERYSSADDQWTGLAEMSAARNGVGVVGAEGLLYAIGGFDGVSPLSSAEQYSPATNKWLPVPSMSSRRFGLGACCCNGVIYAIGGSDGSNLNTAECYTLATKSWSPLPSMTVSRKFPGVVAHRGQVFAIGGWDGAIRHNSVEKYDPGLRQWISVAPLLVPRSGLGCVALDGFIFAVGGHDGGSPIASVERYDPLVNEWALFHPLSANRDCVGVATVSKVLSRDTVV